MATFDRMIIDDHDLANRYFNENNLDDLESDQYFFSKPFTNNRQQFNSHIQNERDASNKINDNFASFGRRIYLESPSHGSKEEDDVYRYVPSRLSEHPPSVITTSVPAPTNEALIDSLDLELDLLGATNTRHTIPYRTNVQSLQETKSLGPLTQSMNRATQSPMTNMRQADPRQDPLLGPLLAELDAMSTQQRVPQGSRSPIPTYRRNSVPYESNLSQLPNPPKSNQVLTNTANRAVNDALLEAELYDSLDSRNQQTPHHQPRQQIPFSAPNLNSSTQQQQQKRLPPRASNMNSTDIFLPSSYDTGPGSFLSHFGPEDQLFQQPLFNTIGQNYVPNTRQLPASQQQQQQQQQQRQHDQAHTNLDYSNTQISPPYRTAHFPLQPSQTNNNQYQSQQPLPSHQQTIHNSDNNNPFIEYPDVYDSSQYQQPPPTERQQYQRSLLPSQQQQQQNYDEQIQRSMYSSNNQELFFTDHNDDQLDLFSSHRAQPLPPTINQRNPDQQQDSDSKRQAIWNELQRTNAKVQEKNAKKRESTNRREQLLKGTYGSNNPWNNNTNNSQQSSAPAKTGESSPLQRRPPPIPALKTNYIEENIDMIKNKENFYHRYPAKKYENLYSKRKDLGGGKDERRKEQYQNQDSHAEFDQTQSSTSMNNPTATYSNTQHRSSLPVTVNLNPGDKTQTGNLPASVTIPLDSHVSRVGDKISVNIDLRLVDLQNIKNQQQQNNDPPDWTGLDPLDRHIRKLEHSIDQSLPSTHSPAERNRIPTNPTVNASMGRYGKMTRASGGGEYNPPSYSNDYYSYSDKGQKEDSYLAKMNHLKRGSHFKPYTGRDYEQFKKNNGLGNGYLGFDFDNPSYKEKSDKLSKTKEYAQQVEVRNKKILAEAPRRTLSDTRIPTEASKTQRALEYAHVSTRHKPFSGTSIHSTPPDMNVNVPVNRRPTEVARRPPPSQRQSEKPVQNNDNELVERLAKRHEHDKAQVQGILNPSQRRREQFFDDDDRHISDIERLAQDRANQKRLSPPKPLPPTGPLTTGNARRPLRFDKPPVSDELAQSSQQQHRLVEPNYHQEDANDGELVNRHNDEKMLMEAIRQELSERPLADDEELVVVEQ